MMMKHIQKMICVIMLIAVLIPTAASAQNNVQTSSNQTFSNEELAQMLAPIALYPDALLSQILMASTYPFEVVEAERWLTKNPYVAGEALDEALQAMEWDVSVLALCHYPKVLTMMSENLSWTARLGDAFTNQEEDVMDTVQELRARARAAGNLSTTPEQRVIVEDRYIRIDPIGPDYIYVPAYDPYVVYGHWWLPLFPPLPIFLPGLIVTGPGIIFSPRFYVGFGVFGWSSFNWRERHVVIVDIDRTRRYNRRVHDYRGWDKRPWRPDHERRYVRERRGGEIPRFRPPIAPTRETWDRRPGGDVRAPDGRRTTTPDRPRVMDRDKRPGTPRIGDPGRKSDAGKPGDIKKDQRPRGDQPQIKKDRTPADNVPKVIDRDKPKPSDPGTIGKGQPVIRDRGKIEQPRDIDRGRLKPSGPGTMDQGQPVIRDRGKTEQPRVIDRGRPQPSAPATIDKGQPVVRDRGNVEVNRPRVIEQKGPDVVRDRGRGIGGDSRVAPRGDRQDMPQRSMERGDGPDRGGMRGGERK